GGETRVVFRREAGLRVWHYRRGNFLIEKRLHLVHQQNTVHIHYRMLEGEGVVRLELRPGLHFRGHDGRVSAPIVDPYTITAIDDRLEMSDGDNFPPLRLYLSWQNQSFTIRGR